ncbi:hypothetical protein G6F57_022312 [Rhizopus arrhizus]|nr:hypothetical protein G6F57_022312 [Rhizopus arrhizus]
MNALPAERFHVDPGPETRTLPTLPLLLPMCAAAASIPPDEHGAAAGPCGRCATGAAARHRQRSHGAIQVSNVRPVIGYGTAIGDGQRPGEGIANNQVASDSPIRRLDRAGQYLAGTDD